MNGKGSSRRPSQVDHETFSSNWDAIFSKPKRKSRVKRNVETKKDTGKKSKDETTTTN